MQIDYFLERELQHLHYTGSTFAKEVLIKLQRDIKEKASMHFEQALRLSLETLQEETEAFLRTKSLKGISTSLSIGPIYINLVGGESVHGQRIDTETLFDVASITKLPTILLALHLQERDILHFEDTVQSRCSFFENLEDYTIEDLLYMRGEIRTHKRLEQCKSLQEAEDVLRKLYIHDPDRDRFVYTDMGLIALTKIIEAELKRKVPISLGYAGIMRFFILEPFHLYHTTFFPKGNIAGNGREDFLVNDPKARTLGGSTGSAGLFTNSKDLFILAQELFKKDALISQENLDLLSTPIRDHNKGIGGLYQKYPDFSRTYVPPEYSSKTFASEGTTGSVAIFDRINQLHNTILVDSIDPETGKKPDSFKADYNAYQQKITNLTMELSILQKYHRESERKEYVLKM